MAMGGKTPEERLEAEAKLRKDAKRGEGDAAVNEADARRAVAARAAETRKGTRDVDGDKVASA